MIDKSEIIKEIQTMKGRINCYLIENDMKDDELIEISISMEGYLDQYEWDNLSDDEKRRREIMGEMNGICYLMEEYMKNLDK